MKNKIAVVHVRIAVGLKRLKINLQTWLPTGLQIMLIVLVLFDCLFVGGSCLFAGASCKLFLAPSDC